MERILPISSLQNRIIYLISHGRELVPNLNMILTGRGTIHEKINSRLFIFLADFIEYEQQLQKRVSFWQEKFCKFSFALSPYLTVEEVLVDDVVDRFRDIYQVDESLPITDIDRLFFDKLNFFVEKMWDQKRKLLERIRQYMTESIERRLIKIDKNKKIKDKKVALWLLAHFVDTVFFTKLCKDFNIEETIPVLAFVHSLFRVRITKETSIKAEFMFQLAKMRGKTVTQAIEDMYSAEDFPQDCRNSIKSFFRKLGYHRNEIVLNFSESKPLVKFVKKKINVDSEKEPLVPAIESKTKPMSSKSKPTKHELEKKIQELTEENELMKEEGEEQKEKNAQTVKKMKKLGEDLDENGSSTSSESDEEGSDSDNEEEYNGNFERKSDHVDPGSVDKESPPHIIKAHLKDDSKPDGMRDITPRDRYIDNEYLIYEVRAFGKTKHCSFRELPECDSIASDLKSKRYMHPNK
eukprot:TRINITY_DN549_c1_g2_i8.p1 TRINITY_DN549_c1_g2~~TRINITY_DN549_c1_g2_i8.p1  ORF type:complete len:465 (+),score=76.77 TRINITY_DN549_c1_g2_i8:428-1822(+)